MTSKVPPSAFSVPEGTLTPLWFCGVRFIGSYPLNT